MATKEYVESVLRAVLISCKGAASLHRACCDYKQLEGNDIPYAELGYRSVEECIRNLPGIKVFKESNGEVKLDAIPTENTRHIADMVARQKTVAKRPVPKSYNQYRTYKNENWKKPSTSNGYRNQFYKQATPYRPHYNNNSTYSYNQNYYSKKSSQPPYKSTYGYAEASKKTSPDRPEARPGPAKTVKSAPGPTPTPAPVPAASKAKTPATERKHSSLTLTARLQAAILADEAENPPSASAAQGNHPNKALGRMSSLRSSLASDTVPLPLPATRDVAPDPTPVQQSPSLPAPAVAAPRQLPDPPPDSASSEDKLAWMCSKLNLPAPTYKMSNMRDKLKKEVCHFCAVKVGGSYSAMTYPEASESEASAREMAARRLLKELEGSERVGLATSAPGAALARLVAFIDEHPCGLWASTVPHLYRENFNENLPANWQELVESSPMFANERGANGQLVILPKSSLPVMKRVGCSGVNELTVQSEVASDSSEVGGVRELPELRFPEEQDWNVYVTTAYSTTDVWLQLIGDDYSNAYSTLRHEMESYYNVLGAPVTNVELMSWYTVNLDDSWYRVRVLELLDGDQVLVFLGDHGEEEVVPVSAMRLLMPQFTELSAQAFQCRLDGLEELGDSPLVTDITFGHLVGQVFVAVSDSDLTDDVVPVVLYRTNDDEDINVNKEILKQICAHGTMNITEKLLEVEVGCVSAEGAVWLVAPEGAALVRAALQILTTSPGPYYRPPLDAVPAALPKSNQMYMVRAISGEWLRCTVRAGIAPDGSVSTRLVDSGQTMRAPFLDLKPLATYSDFLACYPPQAHAVRLGSAERAAQYMVSRLRELLLGTPVLCRALPSPPAPPRPAPVLPRVPDVELFVRSGPQSVLASVNSTILFEFEEQEAVKTITDTKKSPLEALHRKKERIFRSVSAGAGGGGAGSGAGGGGGGGGRRQGIAQSSSSLTPLALPELNDWINVLVTMAANPWNFVVQLTDTQNRRRFMDMMADLQRECPKLTTTESLPAKGDLRTLFYEKDSWYRVVVANVVSSDMVSVYFCDFGDLALVTAAELHRVPDTVPDARLLPPQALKAKLHGVAPPHQDWSVEDCIRFQELCVHQDFAGRVTAVERDPLNPSEPLLSLDLIDTSTAVDIYLNQLLVSEGRAKLTDPVS